MYYELDADTEERADTTVAELPGLVARGVITDETMIWAQVLGDEWMPYSEACALLFAEHDSGDGPAAAEPEGEIGYRSPASSGAEAAAEAAKERRKAKRQQQQQQQVQVETAAVAATAAAVGNDDDDDDSEPEDPDMADEAPTPAPALVTELLPGAADGEESEPEDPDMADEVPTPAPALVTELLPGAADGEESEPEDPDLLEEGREEEEDPQPPVPLPSAVAAPVADISGALDVEQPVTPAPQTVAAAPNGGTARERRAARAQRLAELSAEDGEYMAPEPWPDGDGDPEGRFSVRVRIVGNRGQPSWRRQPDVMDAACALEDGGGSSTQWETVTVRGVRLVSRAQMKFEARARAEQQERLAAEEAAAEAEAARVAEQERLAAEEAAAEAEAARVAEQERFAAEEAAAEAERARLAAEAKAARLAREEEAARRRREEAMATLLQAVIRGRREWRGHRDRRQAALVIEAAVRRWGARAAYAGLRGAVMLAQRWQRGRR
eukprot:COSAG01_NODE_5426_length_4271_cov_8.295781_1_plen_497_part_00